MFSRRAALLGMMASLAATPALAQAAPNRLATRLNALALRLLSAQAARGVNIGVSGLSLAEALAPLAPAARGEAADALASLLGRRGVAEVAALTRNFNDVSSLRRATALWLPQRRPPRASYLTAIAPLGVSIEQVAFGSPETLERINGWVAERTGGMIPRLLDRVPADASLVITAALHLAMPWAIAFDAEQTRPLPFRRPRATPIEVPFMHDTRQVSYAQTGRLHAIRIPYRESGFALTLVVPQADQPAETMAGLLRRGGLGTTLAGLSFTDTRVDIAIPRVTLRHGADLVPMLRNGALAPVFAPDADFRGATGEAVRITTIRQEVALQWDEAGTEAAAATAVIGTRAISDHPRFVADRPFLAFLTHVPSGLQIFSAFIVMPTGGT